MIIAVLKEETWLCAPCIITVQFRRGSHCQRSRCEETSNSPHCITLKSNSFGIPCVKHRPDAAGVAISVWCYRTHTVPLKSVHIFSLHFHYRFCRNRTNLSAFGSNPDRRRGSGQYGLYGRGLDWPVICCHDTVICCQIPPLPTQCFSANAVRLPRVVVPLLSLCHMAASCPGCAAVESGPLLVPHRSIQKPRGGSLTTAQRAASGEALPQRTTSQRRVAGDGYVLDARAVTC
jgi:hypothetical protein